MRSPSSSTTNSPHSTPSAPTKSSPASPAPNVITVGETPTVRSDTGTLGLIVDATFADVPDPDVIVVPGGPGKALHLTDSPLQRWLRAADTTSTWTTSVCTGSFILAAAGLLTGRRATTHWQSVDHLADYGAIPVSERVVIDGKYVTGAGVSAGIDMALTLAAHIAGDTIAQTPPTGHRIRPTTPFPRRLTHHRTRGSHRRTHQVGRNRPAGATNANASRTAISRCSPTTPPQRPTAAAAACSAARVHAQPFSVNTTSRARASLGCGRRTT